MTRIDSRLWTGRTSKPDSLTPSERREWAYRALLDGKDVSARCFLADDETGEVGLYRTNTGTWPGAFYQDPETGGPAIEFRRGAVTLIPPEG
jgi:hypothetical protein